MRNRLRSVRNGPKLVQNRVRSVRKGSHVERNRVRSVKHGSQVVGNRVRSATRGEIGFVPLREGKSGSFRCVVGLVLFHRFFFSASSWRLLASWRFNSPHFPAESFQVGRADQNARLPPEIRSWEAGRPNTVFPNPSDRSMRRPGPDDVAAGEDRPFDADSTEVDRAVRLADRGHATEAGPEAAGHVIFHREVAGDVVLFDKF